MRLRNLNLFHCIRRKNSPPAAGMQTVVIKTALTNFTAVDIPFVIGGAGVSGKNRPDGHKAVYRAVINGGAMRYSGIGGQAVMEGVLMRNGERYAVAVRKPDGEIIVDAQQYRGILPETKVKNVPFVRGVINFVNSLALGMKTLMYSASFYEEEPEAARPGEKEQIPSGKIGECAKTAKPGEKESAEKKPGSDDRLLLGGTVAVSILAAVGLFILAPYFISGIFRPFVHSAAVLALIEGALRLAIFFTYILLISRMEDIQRVFMYHGAEHKCINCIEHGLELNVENVRNSSRLHKRCGTSFLFLVVCISIVFFIFIRTDSALLRIALRLLFVPVIAGVAYECIRLAGRSGNKLVELLSMPGMALQKLTTREPDDAMIEVGIASVEAVFDWKAYLEDWHDV